MPRIAFEELPDHGRLWVFPMSRSLDEVETERCVAIVDEFLSRWAAHGMPLRSGREFVEGRFLLVGVDVDAEAPSGCSIDALVNQLRDMGQATGVTLIDHAPVWYRSADGIETVSRADFRALATAGDVTASTHVFDSSLTRIDEFRGGALERPASETWHGRVFFKEAAAT